VIRKTSSIQKGAENGPPFFSSGFTPSILAIQNLQLKGMATFSKGLEQIIGIHIHPQRRSAISLNGV